MVSDQKRREDRKTRANRKDAGYVEVKAIVPPSLVQIMDGQRGEIPRSQWLVRAAFQVVGLEPTDLHRRPGRPRTRNVQSAPVPMEDLRFRMTSWWDITARYRSGDDLRGCIGRRDRDDDLTELRWTYSATFGDFDPYKAVKNIKGRQWTGLYWQVPRASADRLCEKAQAAGAEIVPIDPPTDWTGIAVEIRPLIRLTDEQPQFWTAEIDFDYLQESVPPRVLAAFVRGYWGDGGAKWATVMDGFRTTARVVTGPLSAATVTAIRTELASHNVEVIDGPPCGITAEPVVAERDELGLLVNIRVDPRDRRSFALTDHDTATDWDGRRAFSANLWPHNRDLILRQGFGLEERGWDAREFPRLDWSQIPGGDQPVNGRRLRDYQRAGVEFVLRHQGRAVVGDEMGTGKTAQVIVALRATGARRFLVIAPKNAVGVWMREIRTWMPDYQEIVVVQGSTEVPVLPQAGWVIVTYDTLTPRTETIPLTGYSAEQMKDIWLAFVAAGAEDALEVTWDNMTTKEEVKGLKVRLDPDHEDLLDAVEHLNPPTGFNHGQRIADALQRARGVLRQALLDWTPDAAAIDEAHRIKNPRANRTRTVRMIVQDPQRAAVLLTGTPLRNRAEEGLDLLEALVPLQEYRWMASKHGVRQVDLAQALLGKYMIRRTKKEVNPELPQKIRQRLDIEGGSRAAEVLQDYLDTMAYAQEVYTKELLLSRDRQKAAEAAMGLWSKARRLLGIAKVVDGVVADLICDVVDERGCCIAFAHHRDVLALLEEQLDTLGLTVAVVHGGTSAAERAEAERAFQAGEVDVFLGGVTAAGESITLTRADTCLFAELAWVPAELLQAEDRGHRVGQTANGYHILTCIAGLGLPLADNMDALMWHALVRKLREINEILGEDTTLEFAEYLPEGEVNVRAMLEARAWAKAEEQFRNEGIADKDLNEIRSPGFSRKV
ncbi:DEAD/DEAH box helicase [Azospirillum sp. RWY-5-1]|uniref:DEAD/DEAH box helicase n=1 Tax=Azospirillum oleiclasticum TaxID=2735135 RepID=A0ABX2T3W8_9PROT|nr:DEAD/DEAH box helicase [Azospirillum oleiclasticum]NYZ11616.1 DEAD/DEAH box helicase [Azospirillum oleiclasticum]NYZ18777.1 DEAD/DEAH box helicase [Azospirillum oleiclasticum]